MAWKNYVRLDRDTQDWDNNEQGRGNNSVTRHHTGRFRLFRRILFAPTPTFVIVTLVIFLYGSMRFWNGNGTFFMKPLSDTMLPTVRASCVIGSSDSNDMTGYLNQTVEYAKQGSEIVIWSETAVLMKNAQMTDQFLAVAKNISTTYGIYLGVTYSQFLDAQLIQSKNMFTLLDPNGEIAFMYQKAHPVTMVETTVTAGPNVLPVADSEKFGRLGGSICFDMDFQNFIAQAGKKKVDLMLQPSWTWGKIID